MSEHDTQALPDTVEPTPPKPTLASLIVDKMESSQLTLVAIHEDLWKNQRDLLIRITSTHALATIAIGIASLSVLLNITLIVLVAWLVGHVR